MFTMMMMVMPNLHHRPINNIIFGCLMKLWTTSPCIQIQFLTKEDGENHEIIKSHPIQFRFLFSFSFSYQHLLIGLVDIGSLY